MQVESWGSSLLWNLLLQGQSLAAETGYWDMDCQVSGRDALWTPPWGGVPGMSSQEETLDSDYISDLAWENLGILPEELVKVASERTVYPTETAA